MHKYGEIALLFILFTFYGAYPVPDVNEVYYISKAIHFWQPSWIPGDEFLNGRDSHWFFYAVFGWLSWLFSPNVMTWIGRLICWFLLAWSWQRLSFTLIPVRFASALTGLGLAYYTLNFHESGEWIIGGFEGKTFAYPLVFFALNAMLRQQWNRCFLFLGLANAFHILVGGWATAIIIAHFVFYVLYGSTKLETQNVKFIVVFFALTLCGLIPALMLDYGTASETVRQAHQIYCFDRLQHHLVPYLFQPQLRWRFFLLTLIWLLLRNPNNPQLSSVHHQLSTVILGTLVLAAIGYAGAYLLQSNRALSAEFLRFYWFRWADIAVPMGASIAAGTAFFSAGTKTRSLTALLVLTLLYPMADIRSRQMYPRSEPVGVNGQVAAPYWYDVCGWIRNNTPPDAKFWIPRDGTTFKWYARRADAGTWKNIPQDADGIVHWRQAMHDLFTYRGTTDRMLTALVFTMTDADLKALRSKYQFHYVVCFQPPENTAPVAAALKKVYENERYCVIMLTDEL